MLLKNGISFFIIIKHSSFRILSGTVERYSIIEISRSISLSHKSEGDRGADEPPAFLLASTDKLRDTAAIFAQQLKPRPSVYHFLINGEIIRTVIGDI